MPPFALRTSWFASAAVCSALTWIGCAAPDPLAIPSDHQTDLGVKYSPIVNGVEENGRDNVVFVFNRGGSCTGTLVSDRVVLTAKHCVQSPNATGPARANQLTVGIGPRAFGGGMKFFTGAAVDATPGVYTDGALGVQDLVGSDVALITLATSPGLAPMRMKLGSPLDEEGQRATAVGFGLTPGGGQSGTKYTVDTTVGRINGNTIQVDGTICQGDSGGPLINKKGETFGVVSFGTAMGCGGGANFYQRIDIWKDLIDSAIEKSKVCSDDGVEACDGFDNDCDNLVDEDCAAIGEPCKEDIDCATLLCATTDNGKVCATICDPLAPDSGCDKGFFCASTTSCQGVCLEGTAGAKAFGDTCESNSECKSLFCVDPGDNLRRCLVPCRGGESDCLSQEACVARAGQCGSCVDSELVSSALGPDEPCNSDEGCRSGKCYDDGGTKYCVDACDSDGDCDSGHHCRDNVCARGPRAGLGGVCEEHADCLKGFFCAETADKGDFCTRTCSAKEPCGDGFSCSKVSNGSVCVPDDVALGGPCASDKECVSGLCHEASGTCTRRCKDPTACGVGLECVRSGDTGGLCLSPEAAAVDPGLGGEADGGADDAPKKSDDGCALAPGASRTSGAAVLWAVGLAASLWIRRRRAS